MNMKRQKPIKGGRHSLPASVLKEINYAVEREASRYGVSKSFVISVALATFFRVKEQERY